MKFFRDRFIPTAIALGGGGVDCTVKYDKANYKSNILINKLTGYIDFINGYVKKTSAIKINKPDDLSIYDIDNNSILDNDTAGLNYRIKHDIPIEYAKATFILHIDNDASIDTVKEITNKIVVNSNGYYKTIFKKNKGDILILNGKDITNAIEVSARGTDKKYNLELPLLNNIREPLTNDIATLVLMPDENKKLQSYDDNPTNNISVISDKPTDINYINNGISTIVLSNDNEDYVLKINGNKVKSTNETLKYPFTKEQLSNIEYDYLSTMIKDITDSSEIDDDKIVFNGSGFTINVSNGTGTGAILVNDESLDNGQAKLLENTDNATIKPNNN